MPQGQPQAQPPGQWAAVREAGVGRAGSQRVVVEGRFRAGSVGPHFPHYVVALFGAAHFFLGGLAAQQGVVQVGHEIG